MMGTANQTRSYARRIRFTLVELLVVIAIISILASMLMPALQNAFSAARIASCMSNQHQISIAFNMYPSDADGFISPQWYNVTNTGISVGLSDGYGSRNPNDRVKMYWNGWAKAVGLGVLSHLGYLEDGRVFYCPDQDNEQFSWEGTSSSGDMSSNKMPSSVLTKEPGDRPYNACINSSYMYRPYGSCSSGHADNPSHASCYLPNILYRKMGQANPYHIVSCDQVFRVNEMSHVDADVVPKINASRMDGAVISRYPSSGACTEIIKYQASDKNLDQTWGRPDNSCRQGSQWAVMWYVYSLHDDFDGK